MSHVVAGWHNGSRYSFDGNKFSLVIDYGDGLWYHVPIDDATLILPVEFRNELVEEWIMAPLGESDKETEGEKLLNAF